MGALFRSGWGGRGNRRRTAHAQEPPGLRCGVAKFARQQMGFSRDKSLERVRAEPAVAPPDGGMARMGGSTAIASPRARNKGYLHAGRSAPCKHTKPQTGARNEAPLPQASSVAHAPQRPLPHRGKEASTEGIRAVTADSRHIAQHQPHTTPPIKNTAGLCRILRPAAVPCRLSSCVPQQLSIP